jgi:protein-S-isoprenylcysteine O-methyltransferase Ste14
VSTDAGSPLSASLALRSLLWTILLPGVVAAYVPWRFFGLGASREVFGPVPAIGLACMAFGAGLLAACILEFARTGRGTLSPIDPPRHLVVGGLYNYVRNPMYLSVTIIVLGEALWARSLPLAIYWGLWFVVVHLFVVFYEEPYLRRRFGSSYDEYLGRVRRWRPTWRQTTVGERSW